ncbi:uncharacterized protein N7496_003787 [Penicillium cataractarum]|uniref:Uncharacterized protein n=1 Tax=Penicillium cataractarum TaxID=2100454 RepID=A0A9W9SP97_9EURO|nr:uncharacterized protein N7496_003787 [Penicillium cataractarum]KAJ5381359.1 hypothetical protein N7496_003787 [Penicillium cataractarum]
MEPKQEDTTTDLSASFAGLASPPPENEMSKMEEREVVQQGADNHRLQDSLDAVIRQLQALGTVMGRSKLAQDPSTNLYRHRKGILKVANFQYPETRIVGFIGNTGVGKSSVINSILGGNSLARTVIPPNVSMEECVEYRAVDEEHQKPYTVEVDFMDPKEMKGFLEDHLQSYRRWYFELEKPKEMRPTDEDWNTAYDADGVEGFEDGDEAKLTQSEIVKLQKAKQSAQETFKALFKGADEPSLEDLVRDGNPEAEIGILDALFEKAKKGLTSRPGGEEAVLYTETSQGLEECRELLDLLTTDSRGETPAVWPFIKLIRVYLDAPILKTGLVLADMPGLRDLNYARQEATERYIQKQCHVLGFVTRISRCLADETIEEVNWKTWTEMPRIVIATRADEVEGAGSDRSDPDHDQVLRDLDVRIKQAKDEAATIYSLMRKARGSEKGDLAEKWDELKYEEENLEFKKKKVQVDYRNNKTIAGMASMPSRKDMTVFCVGNNDYLANCKGETEQEKAYTELSGIPQLRQYCQCIPAEAQMRHVSNFCQFIVPGAIASMRLWANGAFDRNEMAKARGISEMLKRVEDDLVSEFKFSKCGLVGATRTELERLFKRRIGGAIDEFQPEWEDTCTELCDGWVELIQPTCEKITGSWDEFMHCLNEQQERIAEEITKKINQIYAPFEVDHGLTSTSQTILLKGMQFRKAAIVEAFHRAFQEAMKDAKIVKDSMVNFKDNKTAIITKYMLPAYQFANAQRGKGCDSQRKRHMEDHIKPGNSKNSGVICKFKVLSQRAWSQALRPHFKTLQQKVSEVVDQAVSDLQVVAGDQGKLPEACGDVTTAGDVMEQLKVLEEALNHIQGVLHELKATGSEA